MQPKFNARIGSRPSRLIGHPRFRAGYDFLLLRCASGEADQALGLWLGEFQDANLERRAEMLQPESTGEKKRRRRKPRKKPETGVTSESAE